MNCKYCKEELEYEAIEIDNQDYYCDKECFKKDLMKYKDNVDEAMNNYIAFFDIVELDDDDIKEINYNDSIVEE